MRANNRFLAIVILGPLVAMAAVADAQPVVPSLPGGSKYQYIFVTSTITNVTSDSAYPPIFPGFGSVAGADWIVTLSAFNSGALPGWNGVDQTFRALLSTSTENAKDRVGVTNPVYNTAGQLVATGHADLFDTQIANPIQYNEFGLEETTNLLVWTGSSASGQANGDDCLDWNNPSPGSNGIKGLLNSTTGTWLNSSFQACDQTARLYGVSPEWTVPNATDAAPLATGLNQNASLSGGATAVTGLAVTFDNVTTAGDLQLNVFADAVVNDGFRAQLGFANDPTGTLLGDTYLGLSFSGQFSGDAQLVFDYDPSGLDPDEEASLRLLHYDPYVLNQWVDITTALDLGSDRISGLTDYLYSPFVLSYTATIEPLPGDGNGDGWVNGLDYLLWASAFGTHPGPNGDPSDGDYNDDGWVTGLDYLLWAGNFGTHNGVAVPEPGACMLLAVGGLAIALLRRR